MHLIPINSSNDLNFTQPKPKAADEDLQRVQRKILENL
jgi:histidine triad (HIT) family protein